MVRSTTVVPLGEPEIIYENSDFLILAKPAGLQIHAARAAPKKSAATPPEPTLVDWLVAHYPEVRTVGDDPALRPGIVHRLDKDTSGIMVVARTQRAFNYLKELFQKHEVKKTYLAVVRGVPREKRGTINAPIGIRSGTLKRSIRSAKMAKPALTEYRVIKTFAPEGADAAGGVGAHAATSSLLEVTPRTGRTHQIRVHLASIGHPVLGDRLYGPWSRSFARRRTTAPRLLLHALSLEFTAPDGKRMKFEAEPPPGFFRAE